MKCLPSSVAKLLAIVFDEAAIFREFRRFVVRQVHSVVIGMMEGYTPQPIYTMQEDHASPDASGDQDASERLQVHMFPDDQGAGSDQWVAAMAEGEGSKGKGGKPK